MCDTRSILEQLAEIEKVFEDIFRMHSKALEKVKREHLQRLKDLEDKLDKILESVPNEKRDLEVNRISDLIDEEEKRYVTEAQALRLNYDQRFEKLTQNKRNLTEKLDAYHMSEQLECKIIKLRHRIEELSALRVKISMNWSSEIKTHTEGIAKLYVELNTLQSKALERPQYVADERLKYLCETIPQHEEYLKLLNNLLSSELKDNDTQTAEHEALLAIALEDHQRLVLKIRSIVS